MSYNRLICLFIHLFICPSVHISIHPSKDSSTECYSRQEQEHLLIYSIFYFISHPSDEKDHSLFSKNISAANLAALIDRHSGQSEPSNNMTNHREADGEKVKTARLLIKHYQRLTLMEHSHGVTHMFETS